MTTHTQFKARIYVLTADEGGRSQMFFDGYRPHFDFPDQESINGAVSLPEDHSMVNPGDTLEVTVKLNEAAEMEVGTRFEAHESGRRQFTNNEWVQVSEDKTVIRGEVLNIIT